MRIKVKESRGRGRPNKMSVNCVKDGLREKKLVGDECEDRAEWRQLIRNLDPVIKPFKVKKIKNIWRPPSLSELTQY